MKGKSSLMSQLFGCVLLLTMLFTTSAITAAGLTIRAELTHVDSGRGFTKSELVSRMAARSRARTTSLHRGGGGNYGYGGHPATSPAAPGTVLHPGTEYLIHFAIGMPRPQHVALTLDTGSDLIWTQCKPCMNCFPQPSPVFEPSASKTFYNVPCTDPSCATSSVTTCFTDSHLCLYEYGYGDGSITLGKMVRDAFVFSAPNGGKGGTTVVPNLSFGCGFFNAGVYNTDESGIAGFGRGPQSLPSQLKVGKFSHCFTSMLESSSGKSSPVFLGTPDDLRAHATGPIQSTPMPKYDDTFYYLTFKGITVGTTRLAIDESVFTFKGGNTGTIIDSGTSITTFPQAVHDQLTDAFTSQMRLRSVIADVGGPRQCFALPEGADEKKVPVPKLVFHLAGADMDLPRENYMFVDRGKELICLMVDGYSEQQTIIGNFQQQNMHIIYDMANNKLLFVPAQCDKL